MSAWIGRGHVVGSRQLTLFTSKDVNLAAGVQRNFNAVGLGDNYVPES
jgi:hypothetical protein